MVFHAFIALISAILAFLFLLGSNDQLKIHKGVTAPAKYNFAVFIVDNEDSICTGFILDDETIGGAGHCFYKHVASSLTVYVGHHEPYKGRKYKVQQIFIHDDFEFETEFFDAAVLKLKKSIKFRDPGYISSPIDLPTQPLTYGTRCRLFGYGFIDEEETLPKKLQMASLKTMDYKDCKKFLIPGKRLKPSQFCAGEQNAVNGCSGDSGGPLVCSVNGHDYLYGVFSKTTRFSCDNPDARNIFTNVDNSAISSFLRNI